MAKAGNLKCSQLKIYLLSLGFKITFVSKIAHLIVCFGIASVNVISELKTKAMFKHGFLHEVGCYFDMGAGIAKLFHLLCLPSSSSPIIFSQWNNCRGPGSVIDAMTFGRIIS